MTLEAVIPLATSRSERVESYAGIVTALGAAFPGLVIHTVAREVTGTSDKATANADLARCLGSVAADHVVFIEDDVALSGGFREAVERSIRRLDKREKLGMVSLFSRRDGPPGFRPVPDRRFKQSQCVVMHRRVAIEWARQLRDVHPTRDWDVVLCRAPLVLGLEVEELLPSVAQHRCIPSVFGHHADYTAPTYSQEG